MEQMKQDGTGSVILKKEPVPLNTHTEEKFKSRNWCFTLNNYTEKEVEQMEHLVNCKMVCSKEVGERGTPHLQGYVEFPSARTLSGVKKTIGINKIHLEPSYKGRLANIRYCTKEEDIVRNDFPSIQQYRGQDLPQETCLYPWQRSILEIILKPKTNNRKILWIYEPSGNTGKSMFGKYLEFHNKDVCYTRISKSADILTSASLEYTTYYFDFPRVLGPTFCPFTALECILDGVVDDCKLKKTPRKLRFMPPWVIVVSNFIPDKKLLSEDRWRIFTITDKLQLKEQCEELMDE